MTPYSPTLARETTTRQWNGRLEHRNRRPIALHWETSTAADGSPMVSARVESPFAQHALLVFVREGSLVLDTTGPCQQPTFDYSLGRTACVWRTGGVWVELWHPESALVVPGPPTSLVPAAVPKPRGLWRSPSARLPFGRKRAAALTSKEN